MQDCFLQGDFNTAIEIQNKLVKLNEVLFCQTSPMPVKYAVSLLGYCNGELRLPLVELDNNYKKQVSEAMQELGLI